MENQEKPEGLYKLLQDPANIGYYVKRVDIFSDLECFHPLKSLESSKAVMNQLLAALIKYCPNIEVLEFEAKTGRTRCGIMCKM